MKMTNGIINYNQGEIILVNFPYRDSNGRLTNKKRPVLIISKSSYNKRNNCLIMCPITSKIRYWEK
jgi:mRNA-degrading endonuclease toxin of MazEF toxin-antitoxin module